MAIPVGHKANLETIIAAAKAGDLAVLETTEKATGKAVCVLTAVHRDGKNGDYILTPLAKLFDGNPYDELEAP